LTIFGLVVTLTVDLLTANSNQFISTPNCTYSVSLVIFSQAIFYRAALYATGYRQS